MTSVADASIASASKRSPLLHLLGLPSPVKVDDGGQIKKIEKEEGRDINVDVDVDDDAREDDYFPQNGLSSNASTTIPGWTRNTRSPSPPLAASSPKKQKTRTTYRPPIGNSLLTPPTTTRASVTRPAFQEMTDVASSPSKENKRSASGSKRQLMPSIPTRKESATSIEGLGGRSKSSTNIQTLAQAIAVRAQHVATANANALAKASQPDISTKHPVTLTHTDSSESPLDHSLAVIPNIDHNSVSDSFPGSGLGSDKESLRPEEGGDLVLGQAFLAARRSLKRDSSKEVAGSANDSRISKAGWNNEEKYAEQESKGAKSNDTTNGIVKTSNSDHGISKGPSSHGIQSQPAKINTELSSVLKGRSADSRNSSSSEEVSPDGVPGKASSSTADLDVFEGTSSSIVKGMNSSSQDGYATAPDATTSLADIDSPLLAFPMSSTNGSPPSSPAGLPRGKRKSRPNPLTLNLLASPKTPASTSLARASMSPLKTPPPTMPPSEPLPPVPPTPSSAYQKVSSINRRLSSSSNSGLESSNPLIAAFTAMASSNNSRNRLESDPGSRIDNSSMPQRRSMQIASAMVSANHATTLAEAENAQAILGQVAVEPSFNEKRASMRALAKAGLSNDTHDALARAVSETVVQKTDQAAGVNTVHAKMIPISQVDKSKGEEEDKVKIVTGEEGIEEEAIVKKMTSALMPESIPVEQSHEEQDSEEAIITTAATRNVVGRMRAQIETRGAKGERDAILNSRKVTSGMPSALISHQIEKAILMPPGDQLDSIDLSTSHAGTSSDFDHSIKTPGAWSVQSRRSELDEDRKHLSSEDGLGRLKESEGKSTGAFGEVSTAFRQLQAEKKVLERVIRATTPFAGLGNGKDLSQYLTGLSSKLALSTAEIKRLLDLLDQQRSIMDYMVETHQLECEAYQEEINDLTEDLNAVEIEAETHRINCIKFTEELDRSHQAIVDARRETGKARDGLSQEMNKRDHFTQLLRAARAELTRMDEERAQAVQAKNKGEVAHNVTRSALESARAEHSAELQSQKETLEIALQSLRAYKSGSATPIPQEPEVFTSNTLSPLSHDDDVTSIAGLQKLLAESRKSQAESERQLQELKSVTLVRSNDEMFSPLNANSSEIEDALRDKLIQQEQDIAELRAAVALGAGTGGTKEEQLASISAGQADQVQQLLADLAEKRTREAQIRSAYKQLRDEMRKLQLSQQQERRRSYLAASTTSSSHGHGVGPPSSYFGIVNLDSSTPSTSPDNISRDIIGPTPRALKRLSLPLVSKQHGGLQLGNILSSAAGGGGAGARSPSALARLSTDGYGGFFSGRKYATSERSGGDEHDEADQSVSLEEQIESMATIPSSS